MDIIFPPKCMMCGKILDRGKTFLTCSECAGKAPLNVGRRCKICATPLESVFGELICPNCRKSKRYFKRAYTPFVYEGGVKNAVKALKFKGKNAYAASLASFMFACIKGENGFDDIDMITFVPIHFNRFGERGYNQSQLLAECLGEFSGLPVTQLLKKKVDTRPLSKTRYSKRSETVRGSFEFCEKTDVRGKCVLLVDDVITTGSTANECAKLLVKNGASAVTVAAVASARRW